MGTVRWSSFVFVGTVGPTFRSGEEVHMLGPLLAAGLLMQDVGSAPRSGQEPIVIVDFLAADRDGAPIEDLSAGEVELKAGGKTRPLLSLERIAPPDGRRSILLLVDEATLYTFEPLMKDAVKQLLDSLLPGDKITYIGTRRARNVLTPGAESVMKNVETMVTGPGALHTCLADMLRNIGVAAQRLPQGRGSTLVVLGRGHPEGASEGSEGDAPPCTPRRQEMRGAADFLAARQVNLMLFTVDNNSRSWGFETLAGNIHASSLLLSWSNPAALARALASTRSFYRATFAADPAAREQPQRLEVKVKRPRVKVTVTPAVVIKAPARSQPE